MLRKIKELETDLVEKEEKIHKLTNSFKRQEEIINLYKKTFGIFTMLNLYLVYINYLYFKKMKMT